MRQGDEVDLLPQLSVVHRASFPCCNFDVGKKFTVYTFTKQQWD
jgi:hypothetical protein